MMNKNIDVSKAIGIAQSEQLIDIESVHSLKQVSEEIRQAINAVEEYRNQVGTLEPPFVNGQPWYKFSFGKASVAEVNKVMEILFHFLKDTFKKVADSQKLQNENDMNICRLLALLAMTERKSFEEIKDIASEVKALSTEDEESVNKLKEFEKTFLQSINDTAIDNTKKEEQMSRLIDYITLFTESKTKKLRAISLSLSEINTKLDKYCTTQDNWIANAKDSISSWQTTISKNLTEINIQQQEILKKIVNDKLSQLDDYFVEMRGKVEEAIAVQDKIIAQEIERQNDIINTSSKTIADKIIDYNTIIEQQTNKIESQNDSIKRLSEAISSAHKKIRLSLLMATISAASLIFMILYIFIRLI